MRFEENFLVIVYAKCPRGQVFRGGLGTRTTVDVDFKKKCDHVLAIEVF